MQMLPQIARGDANKVWIVPSEIGKALEGIGGFLGLSRDAAPPGAEVPPPAAVADGANSDADAAGSITRLPRP